MTCKLLIVLFCFSITVKSQSRFEIPAGTGKLGWEGKQVTGGGHTGSLNIRSGLLLVSTTGLITKGGFSMDMTSIHNSDYKKGEEDMLDTHLQSDDFFSVARFPEASFIITQTSPGPNPLSPNQLTVKGLLTIRGVTNIISFPAVVTISESSATVKAQFPIDRTKWGITYRSSGNWLFSQVKNELIANDILITLDFKLVRVKNL